MSRLLKVPHLHCIVEPDNIFVGAELGCFSKLVQCSILVESAGNQKSPKKVSPATMRRRARQDLQEGGQI